MWVEVKLAAAGALRHLRPRAHVGGVARRRTGARAERRARDHGGNNDKKLQEFDIRISDNWIVRGGRPTSTQRRSCWYATKRVAPLTLYTLPCAGAARRGSPPSAGRLRRARAWPLEAAGAERVGA